MKLTNFFVKIMNYFKIESILSSKNTKNIIKNRRKWKINVFPITAKTKRLNKFK